MFMILEQECLDRNESIEQLREKRELMVSLMESKFNGGQYESPESRP